MHSFNLKVVASGYGEEVVALRTEDMPKADRPVAEVVAVVVVAKQVVAGLPLPLVVEDALEERKQLVEVVALAYQRQAA